MAKRPGPRWHPSKCKRCGVKSADGHYISSRGKCVACALHGLTMGTGRLDMAAKMGLLTTPAPHPGSREQPREAAG